MSPEDNPYHSTPYVDLYPDNDDDNLTPDDLATRDRIIKHINEDHTHHLTLYLKHYSNIPPPPPGTPDPELIDITCAGMTIAYRSSPTSTTPGISFIPFSPPMKSLQDSRKRLVEMAEEASGGKLGNGDGYVLTRVTPPGLVGWIISLFVLQTIVFFCPGVAELVTFPFHDPHHPPAYLGMNPNPNYPADLPDSWYTRYMMLNQAWLVRLLWEWRRMFWVVVVGIHVVEAVVMDYRLVRRWGVSRGGGVWAGWVGLVMVEGVGALKRAERVVKEDGLLGGEGKKRV